MDTYFKRRATEKESAFLRKYGKPGYTLYTIKSSRPNTIQRVTDTYIYLRSENGSVDIRIRRSDLRQALTVLFYRRVITLKRLIKFNAFSSALGAIIKAIMIDICKVVIAKTGSARITLRGLRYVFSGLSKGKGDVQIVKDNGGRFILLNYFNIRNDSSDSWKQNLRDLGYDYKCVILDPGEKTLYDAMKRSDKFVKPIDIDEYAAFVIRHSDIIYQYFTVDKIGDPLVTKQNSEYLGRIVGRKPVPIYHIQSPLDVLQEIIDEGHDVIGIGGSALRSISYQKRKSAFDAIFERYGDSENFHALGLGSMRLLLEYPWFSADASSWLNARIFGKLTTIAGDIKTPRSLSADMALGYNVRTLASLEERYTELQTDFDMYLYSWE
ncbi:hypothetical protein QYF50_06465 [Paenibacillus vini]|uniref:hypothetical protein n=1 Tax=Paenibacillus vini TaxID=1476024 RepID=UPI0025B65AD0|nr:hypothetical protein [Paenibacillus vini]MDN4067534.1 hypothetical protein [Paenibacillus vini]